MVSKERGPKWGPSEPGPRPKPKPRPRPGPRPSKKNIRKPRNKFFDNLISTVDDKTPNF